MKIFKNFLLFIFLIFPFSSFFSPRQVFAVKSCVWQKSVIGAVNERLSLQAEIELSQGDTILKRYVFNGNYWQLANSYNNLPQYDIIRIRQSFSQPKDYIVAGGWIYEDLNKEVKTIICPVNVRIFNKDTVSYPIPTLTFPKNYSEPYHQVVSFNDNYIGAVYYEDLFTPAWEGNNHGQKTFIGDYWSLFVEENNKFKYAETRYTDETWYSFWVDKEIITIPYPNELPKKLNFWLKAPWFYTNSNLPSPEAKPLFLGRLTIYFRSNPRNWVPNPPPLPVKTTNRINNPPKPIVTPFPPLSRVSPDWK